MEFPQLSFAPNPDWEVPQQEACLALWDRFSLPDHIRQHSLLVAQAARALVYRGIDAGCIASDDALLNLQTVEAAALLHDVAKAYTIAHGGSHAQMGASWVLSITKHHVLAQAVHHHVIWPWNSGPFGYATQALSVPLLVAYADKRARHDTFVTLDERFDDLVQRYGKSQHSRDLIQQNYEQSKNLEQVLSTCLEIPLHACTLNSGRLVA